MKRYLFILAAAVFIFSLRGPMAMADWAPGDDYKMHWAQLPDEAGWNVNATKPFVLADDFQCAETGWITDIHFWGSWLGGIPGTILTFTLNIHEDIPAAPPDIEYSRPGLTLWERNYTCG